MTTAIVSKNDTITSTYRTSRRTKEQASIVAKSIGLNLNTAINMFLKAMVRDKTLPFDPAMSPKAQRQLDEAVKEIEDIRAGRKPGKVYTSLDELFLDLEGDND